MKITIQRAEVKGKYARHMLVGELGEVTDGGNKGDVLLQTKHGIVNLSALTDTFDHTYSTVTVLPPGTTLTLTYVPDSMENAVAKLLAEVGKGSEKINAIKYLRDNTGMQLVECKKYVDALEAKMKLAGELPTAEPVNRGTAYWENAPYESQQ